MILLESVLALEDWGEDDGDRPRTLQRNLHCETVNSQRRSLHVEEFSSQPELYFHLDVPAQVDWLPTARMIVIISRV